MKSKLTLYVDQETSRLAHKEAKLSGRSVSGLVKDFFIQRERSRTAEGVSPKVAKWIGVAQTKKTYRQLREERVKDLIRKHEKAK